MLGSPGFVGAQAACTGLHLPCDLMFDAICMQASLNTAVFMHSEDEWPQLRQQSMLPAKIDHLESSR